MAVVTGDMEWNIDMEVNLFHAMRGRKPAGVNRHFQMIAIHDKLSSSAKKVTSNDVWKHLSTLYDLQALYESEIIPFPNKNGDFALADKEMEDLCGKSFPRSSYISNAPSESTTKQEGAGKTISKFNSKQESKVGPQTPKVDSKGEQKPTSTSKTDHRSNTPSSRSESKSSHNSSSSSVTTSASKSSHHSSTLPSPSPKRTKRTRNVNSASASPATPTEPQSKRRR